MTSPSQVRQLHDINVLTANLGFVGFIFYKSSPRNAFDIAPDEIRRLDDKIAKVAVFVDESVEEIEKTVNARNISWVQLHGKESPVICKELGERGLKIIKSFSIGEETTEELSWILNDYEGVSDYFLLDTAGKYSGGNGKKFNWKILSSYHGQTPLILSGGIGPEDIEDIRPLATSGILAGVDINSRFEIEPGNKNLDKIREFAIGCKTDIKKNSEK